MLSKVDCSICQLLALDEKIIIATNTSSTLTDRPDLGDVKKGIRW